MTITTAATVDLDSRLTEQLVVKKIAWRLMPLIIVCYFFAFFDRVNISFAKTALQADIGLSNTAYGFGASLFVVGYVLLEVPSNMMLYRFGARRWIARIMISWGFATAAMVFVHSEWQFYALRFVIGAMEAGFAPGILYYLTLWFPKSHRGRMTSVFFLATAFSGIIGAPISGLILNYFNGLLGLAGWQWLFLAGGVPCVALGVVVLSRFDDGLAQAAWLSEEERRLITVQLERQNSEIGEHSAWRSLLMPNVLLLGFIYFLIQIASYGLNFWAPDLIKAAGGGSAATVGFLTAIPYICGAICMIVVGRLSDASGERPKFIAGLVLAAAFGFFASGLFDRNVVTLIGALAILGGGVVAAIPTFWTLPPKILSGAGAASGIALINTMGQVGGIVSPIMVGSIKDMVGSATPALYVIGCLCIACATLLLTALPRELKAKDMSQINADASALRTSG
ncbi:MFS transporter permease [Bradyrhizobium sacchari]|uniref:Sugar phosphate permease n=1 Tax=Bradyrhizobium sacchari TaxID=1399419 RepID=A0A560JNY4_9BRAD|nr:MFS transporter [Bradyrhizobium sacchari]OPY97005.1 MFS transporter permease [Bradyrhizobium sacchari]TWB58749.1 sugar phosphate permease [Bradyrhizobium sacchari]TWB72891.1 sugar phosphate permease [Bradyrhizobium sacchari]